MLALCFIPSIGCVLLLFKLAFANKKGKPPSRKKAVLEIYKHRHYYRWKKTYLEASSIATATATVAPTIGLLPIPRNPIIST